MPMLPENARIKRNLLSNFGKAISFFQRALGNESLYIQQLEAARQRLEKADAADQSQIAKAQRQYEAAVQKATQLTQQHLEATAEKNQHEVTRDTIARELQRRKNLGIFDILNEWFGTSKSTLEKHVRSHTYKLEGARHKSHKLGERLRGLESKQASLQHTITNHRHKRKSNDRVRNMHEQNAHIIDHIEAICKQHGITIENLHAKGGDGMQHIIAGDFSITHIEELLAWAKAHTHLSSQTSPEDRVKLTFINHVVIPNLDYFVTQSYILQNAVENPSFTDHPHLSQHIAVPYDISQFQRQMEEELKPDATPIRPSNEFAFLLDETQGTHFERLERAMLLANGKMKGFKDKYNEIVQNITTTIERIEEKSQNIVDNTKKRESAQSHNEQLSKRQEELDLQGTAKLDAVNSRNSVRMDYTLMQTVGHYGVKGAGAIGSCFIPGLFLLTNEVAELIRPNLGNALVLEKAVKASATAEKETFDKLSALLESRKIDEAEIEKTITELKRSKEEMNALILSLGGEKDETKRRAIGEAFVNKSLLTFGLHISQAIRDACEPGSIDEFLASFKSDPQLHDSITRLAFGCADSNDISILLAEANAITSPQPGHQAIFKELVENVIKPNIAEFFMHASQVDFIYQANMTGLATPLHNARAMVRNAHDARMATLFADSFGVESDMGALTVRGAVDVHNLFAFYLHRHGDKLITDAKLRDGKITGQAVKKAVNVLDEETLERHTFLAKQAQNFRQTSPEISDMFLRICGYEYFCPQAPNTMDSDIMQNPEAPASYIMANKVIHAFVERLALSPMEKYREHVGGKLDNLLAQTFMDFFAQLGNTHAADSNLGIKKSEIKQAAKETNTFGFVFDSYTNKITNDALSRYDLFLKIYERNLKKQLECLPDKDKKLLLEEINAVHQMTEGKLSPAPDIMDPQSSISRARRHNHTYRNTGWGASQDI